MTVASDHELFDALADRPDLLALADAIAATQGRRRRSRRRPLALLVAAAAVAAVVLAAPWGESGPDVIENALAGIGNGPVLHATVEYSADDAIIDLATGRSTPRRHRTEYWFDAERKTLRTRLSTDGVKLTESVVTPDAFYSDAGRFKAQPRFPPELEPALAAFVTGYRDALEDGTAQEIGKSKIGLTPVTLLTFARPGGEVLMIAVDDETGKPLRFSSMYAGGRRSPDWTVREIETIARDASLFAPPALASPPRTLYGTVSKERPISLRAAAAALGAEPVWLGASFRGRPLISVKISDATAELTDRRTLEGVVLRLRYGRIRVSMAKGFAGSVAFGIRNAPQPPLGSVAVTRDSGGIRGWAGGLRVHGLYVALSAPTSVELVDAARALRPRR